MNHRLITRPDFENLVALEVAKGATSDQALRRKLLEQMIDEELRVQRAIELNLHQSDPRARMDLAAAVVDLATARVGRDTLDEVTLKAFFDSRRELFLQRGPLHVSQVWVGIIAGDLAEAFNRARAAARLLRKGEELEAVQAIVGTPPPRPIPGRLLAPAELAKFLGPDALFAALLLAPGEVSDPIRTSEGFHVLRVVQRRPHDTIDFERARLDAEAVYWSEESRRAIEKGTNDLRSRASIERASSL